MVATKYTIEAKPTTYNGTTFRSRHEAKWAIMFDLMGWAWEYEPAHPELGTWLPDFYLGENILAEVKPSLNYFETNKYRKAIESLGQDMDECGNFMNRYEILLLTSPFYDCNDGYCDFKVSLGEFIDNSDCMGFAIPILVNGKIGFRYSRDYQDRITGRHLKDNYMYCEKGPIQKLWIEAGNKVNLLK